MVCRFGTLGQRFPEEDLLKSMLRILQMCKVMAKLKLHACLTIQTLYLYDLSYLLLSFFIKNNVFMCLQANSSGQS